LTETDDDLRRRLDQASPGESLLRVRRTEDAELKAKGIAPTISPGVSLMITNRQRAALRELGFSDESIRQMTPSEAHEKLGLA